MEYHHESENDMEGLFSNIPFINEDDYDYFSPPSEELIYKEENYEKLNNIELNELMNDTENLLQIELSEKPLKGQVIRYAEIPGSAIYNLGLKTWPYQSKRAIQYPNFNLALCEYIYKYGNILERYGGYFDFPCDIKIDIEGILYDGLFKGEKLIDNQSIIRTQGGFGSSLLPYDPINIVQKLKKVLENINKEIFINERLAIALGYKTDKIKLPIELITKIFEDNKEILQKGKGRKKTKRRF